MWDIFYGLASHDSAGLVFAIVVILIASWQVRQRHSKTGRIIAGSFVLIGLLLAGGAFTHLSYLSRIAEQFPAPGEFVEVDGVNIHILAEGEPVGPTVVWFGGGHVGGMSMYDFHKDIKESTRSILIDRPGTGWSDIGTFPRTTAKEAVEMMKALEAAGEKGPFVFVGHSFGGLLGVNMARRYPQKTAAVVLLDATPLNTLIYGPRPRGLEEMRTSAAWTGFWRLFGFYQKQEPAEGQDIYTAPMQTAMMNMAESGASFAVASIFKELDPHELVKVAWDTVVHEGELGDMPVYLVAPNTDTDPGTQPYVDFVAESEGIDADRFYNALLTSREQYMRISSNTTRIYSPTGTGHNFPYEAPDFVVDVVNRVLDEIKPTVYQQLTTKWPGDYGGLPPFDLVTPDNLQEAIEEAVEEKRVEINAVADNTAPASFRNTILAIEQSGQALAHIEAILGVYATTKTSDEIRSVAAATAALRSKLNDDILQNRKLFTRVEAVFGALPASAPKDADRRLTEVIYERFVRGGARLDDDQKARLREINAEIAALSGSYSQNLIQEQDMLTYFFKDEALMDGLSDVWKAKAKAASEAAGRPDEWAVPILRPNVWPVFQNGHNRDLREVLWKKWMSRGANDNQFNNKENMQKILRLRGELAKLFGYDNYAQYATAARMVSTPENALNMMMKTWDVVKAKTEEEIVDLQKIADAEGADFDLMPWDKLYYVTQSQRERFNMDRNKLAEYMSLDNIKTAMFWAAGEIYDMSFSLIEDAPKVSPDIEVYEVRQNDKLLGVLYVDLMYRQGKSRGSWATQYRSFAHMGDKQPPVVALHSNVPLPEDGKPVLLQWEHANVIFHEFGHTLHTLSNKVKYPSLGSLTVPWDFVEVPSLLNERWLLDHVVLSKFMKHYETDEPMSEEMIDNLINSILDARAFSVNLEYLANSIVDMRLHQLADGRDIDVIALEQAVLDEIGMPQAVDALMKISHASHIFSFSYAAGLYTYLWSDVLASDLAEAFVASPGGLYDKEVSDKYRKAILGNGNLVPIAEAFEAFRGRAPDQNALLRRYNLLQE